MSKYRGTSDGKMLKSSGSDEFGLDVRREKLPKSKASNTVDPKAKLMSKKDPSRGPMC